VVRACAGCARRLYVLVASALCLLIAFPVAYYVARLAGKRKGMLLALLIAPFWISYLIGCRLGQSCCRTTAWSYKLFGLGGPVLGAVQSAVGQPAGGDPRPGVRLRALLILPLYAGLDRLSSDSRSGGGTLARTGFRRSGRVKLRCAGPDHRAAPAETCLCWRLLHQRPLVGVAEDAMAGPT